MTDGERLSLYVDGELSPADREILEARLRIEPALRARLGRLQHLVGALEALPKAEARPRPSWVVPRPVVAAAGLAVGVVAGALLTPRPPSVAVVGPAVVFDGRADVLTDEGTVAIDGRSTLIVEPDPGVARGRVSEDPAMQPTHPLAFVGGAVATFAVLEGSAWFTPTAGPAQELSAGQSLTLGGRSDVPADAHATVESPSSEVATLRARVKALEAELAEARFTGGLAQGQLTATQGKPIAWPAEVPSGATPSAVESRVAAFVASHPELEQVAVDCEEYPCLAVLRRAGEDTAPRQLLEAFQQGLVDASYGDDPGVLQFVSGSDDGEATATLYGLAVLPTGAPDDDLGARVKWRMNALMEGDHP